MWVPLFRSVREKKTQKKKLRLRDNPSPFGSPPHTTPSAPPAPQIVGVTRQQTRYRTDLVSCAYSAFPRAIIRLRVVPPPPGWSGWAAGASVTAYLHPLAATTKKNPSLHLLLLLCSCPLVGNHSYSWARGRASNPSRGGSSMRPGASPRHLRTTSRTSTIARRRREEKER